MMLTGVEDLSITVSAMQQGAYDYVNKPVRSLTELTLRIEQALSHRALVLENKAYQENLEQMVQDRTAELEQRMRELNGLNGILRTELNQNIGKEEDQTRLQKSLVGYGSQLLDFVQQLTSISSGPSEAVADPGVQKAITDCSSQLGELAYRMLGPAPRALELILSKGLILDAGNDVADSKDSRYQRSTPPTRRENCR